MKKYDILVFGTPNIDLIVSPYEKIPEPGEEIRVDSISLHEGGAVSITALGAAKLGLKVAVTGCLGKDVFAQYILNNFKKHGINFFHMDSILENTGISLAMNVDKDRSFITYDGVVKDTDINKVSYEVVEKSRHVHLTSYRGIEDLDDFIKFTKKAKALGTTVSFDTSWDDTKVWSKDIFKLISEVDIVFANLVEAKSYSSEKDLISSVDFFSKFCDHTVIKLGEGGALAKVYGKVSRVSGIDVKAVDTTGAGDSFVAGYLYGYLRGFSPIESLKIGNICGSCSVTSYGGSASFPDISKVNDLLKNLY